MNYSFHLSQKKWISSILVTLVCTPYYEFSNTLFEAQDKFEIRTITSFAFYIQIPRKCNTVYSEPIILNIPKYHNLIYLIRGNVQIHLQYIQLPMECKTQLSFRFALSAFWYSYIFCILKFSRKKAFSHK